MLQSAACYEEIRRDERKGLPIVCCKFDPDHEVDEILDEAQPNSRLSEWARILKSGEMLPTDPEQDLSDFHGFLGHMWGLTAMIQRHIPATSNVNNVNILAAASQEAIHLTFLVLLLLYHQIYPLYRICRRLLSLCNLSLDQWAYRRW